MSKIKVITFTHHETKEELDNFICKVSMQVEEIENDYETKKKFCNGLIDFFNFAYNEKTGRSLDFVVNDEGLLLQLPPTLKYTFTKENYMVTEDEECFLMGNIMLVAVNPNGETVSLTDEEINHYLQYFTENKNLVMNPSKMFTSDI